MATDDMPKTGPSTVILDLFPRQGEWRDGDYFSLPGNRMIELVRANVEVLPTPSLLHQFLARLIFLQMHEFVERGNLGIVMSGPTRVRIGDRHYREPDILFVASRNRRRHHEQYWETVDLVVEIISPDDPDRDVIDKRIDYAQLGIPEYWIVDPRDDSILVLELRAGRYHTTNEPSRTTIALSVVLSGLSLDVAWLFSEARSQ